MEQEQGSGFYMSLGSALIPPPSVQRVAQRFMDRFVMPASGYLWSLARYGLIPGIIVYSVETQTLAGGHVLSYFDLLLPPLLDNGQ